MDEAERSEDVPEGEAAQRTMRSLLRRVDVGLVTAVCAVFVSLLALLTSFSQMRAYKRAQQAGAMPIVDIDLGYNPEGAPLTFTVALENLGVGLADIRRVQAMVDGKPVEEADFQRAVMSPNMMAWARVRDGEAVNYLRPGQRTEPLAWVIDNALMASAGEYFSGALGTPMADADVEVCYCSVYATCWTVRHADREPPERVASCGVDGAPEDTFADWRAARIKK